MLFCPPLPTQVVFIGGTNAYGPSTRPTAFIGQSYKHIMSVNYDPRVEIWASFQSYDSRVIYYDRNVLYKIDHFGLQHIQSFDANVVQTNVSAEHQ